MKKQILYITNIPSPYRVRFFNELGKYCDLTVIFERKYASDRDESWKEYHSENFKAIELRGINIFNDMSFSPLVLKYILNKKYDLIILGGYSTPTSMFSILIMKIFNIKFILNADGGFIKDDNYLIKKIKNFFIGSASGYLSTGTKTNEYLVNYKADISNIDVYPFTSLYKEEISKCVLNDIEKSKLKSKLEISNKYIILSVGSFIHRKGFDILLKSMGNLKNKDVLLIIVGGTPTKEYLNIVNDLQLKNVNFIPFQNFNDLKSYYNIADLFVLPTREDIWGLVINEAMSFGLPVITTDRCVAGIELIKNGENGYIVPVDNIEKLSNAISSILLDDELRKKMRLESLKIIQNYTIENMAATHFEIINKYLF